MASKVPKGPSPMPEVNPEPPPKSTPITDSASSKTAPPAPSSRDNDPAPENLNRRHSTSSSNVDSPKIGRKRSQSEASVTAKVESSVTSPMASSVPEPEKRPKLILRLPFAWRKRPSAPAALEITPTPADEASNPGSSNTAYVGTDSSFKTPLAKRNVPELPLSGSLPITPTVMNASLFNFPELFAYPLPVVSSNPTPAPTPVQPRSPAKLSFFSATDETLLPSATTSTPAASKPISTVPTASHRKSTSLAEHVFSRPKRNRSKSVAAVAPSLKPRVLQKRTSLAALVSNDPPASDFQPPPAPSPSYHPPASDATASHQSYVTNNNTSGQGYDADPPVTIQPQSSKAAKRKASEKEKKAAVEPSDETLDTPQRNIDRAIIDFGADAIEHLKQIHKHIANSLNHFEEKYEDNFFLREILTTSVLTFDLKKKDDNDEDAEDDILDVGSPCSSQPPRSLDTPPPEHNRVSGKLVRQLIQLLPEVERKKLDEVEKVANAIKGEFDLRGKHLLFLGRLIKDQCLMEITIAEHPNSLALFHTHTLQNATRFRNALFLDFSEDFINAHAWLLLNLEEQQLRSYLTLLKYLKPAGSKLGNMFVQKAPDSIAVTNEIVEKIIVEKACDPYIRMLTQLKRKLKQPNVCVVLVYPGITFDDENISPVYFTHEQHFLALSNMGAVVEKVAIHEIFPKGMNPNMNQACDYAIEFVRNKLEDVVKRRPNDRIFVASWGTSCLFVHEAILHVSGISGVIDLAIPMTSASGTRGIAGDKMTRTYCPTLFVIGEDAKNSSYADVFDVLGNFTGQAGLIAVGCADDSLIVDMDTLTEYGITQACIARLIIHHIMDFIEYVVENTDNETHTKKLDLQNPFISTADFAAYVLRSLDDVDPVTEFEQEIS